MPQVMSMCAHQVLSWLCCGGHTRSCVAGPLSWLCTCSNAEHMSHDLGHVLCDVLLCESCPCLRPTCATPPHAQWAVSFHAHNVCVCISAHCDLCIHLCAVGWLASVCACACACVCACVCVAEHVCMYCSYSPEGIFSVHIQLSVHVHVGDVSIFMACPITN